MYNWDLEKIYNGYSEEFEADFKKAEETLEKMGEIDYSEPSSIKVVEKYYRILNEVAPLFESLFTYPSLRMSVNTKDIESLKILGKLNNLSVKSTEKEIPFLQYIKAYPTLLEEVKNNEYLKDFEYSIYKQFDAAKRMLSPETEILLAKLSKSSGEAWERLFDSETSNLVVDYRGEKITLSVARNLAYSPDENVRKDAYFAELAAYKKIEVPVAAALSSIKEEVTTMCEERGYASPLQKTLNQTGMSEKTLAALTESIEEYFPVFRAYLKRKGELLGHNNGCPFYDLFAPLGDKGKSFTIEEAGEYLVSRFSTFNKEISSMMKKAIDNEWIDYLPKEGKVGGAFCAPVFKIKESRILTNFDGEFGSISTLAHELGHAFHNEVMWDKPILHSGYPMQLAETASTFNETFLKDDAVKNAKDKDVKINLLEASISDDCQVIVDIMSRYYFELSVFEKSKDSVLNPQELKELMKEAQLKSYGDGLDKDYLHLYMWCPKGHYYSTGLSFYNFPYAFGQLFAYGLYEIYKEKGDSFFPLYKKILQTAGTMPIRECVLQAGIDTEDKNFWKKSLDNCKGRIEEFLALTE